VSVTLSGDQRDGLARVLAGWPQVARAHYVGGGAVPMLAFEYDESADSAGEASGLIQGVVAAVVPVLGETAGQIAFSAGGPEEIAVIAHDGEVVYTRA